MPEEISPLDVVIGENVRRLRTEKKMSQDELARRVSDITGVTFRQQTVLRTEQGVRPLRFAEAAAIAQVLEVPTQALAARDEDGRNAEQRRRRGAIELLHMDVADAAAGIVVESSKFKPAVRRLRTALEETPDVEELFTPDEVALMRWHATSDWTAAMEEARYSPPVPSDAAVTPEEVRA